MPPDAAPAEETRGSALSRWSAALAGDATALRNLAHKYWYGIYAWWRRVGHGPDEAAAATRASIGRWLSAEPPSAEQPGSDRMRTWVPLRLTKLAQSEEPLEVAGDFPIDATWAEVRFADEPPGDPDAIFERRWALTILEQAMASLRSEYESRGERDLCAELLPFAGYAPHDDDAYAGAGQRAGRSASAMRQAVYQFRTRQRELLRYLASETIADIEELESEMTALLLACDAAGPEASASSLPTVLQAAAPDQMLARAMNSAQISGAGTQRWVPPSISEMARLYPHHEITRMLGRGGMGAVYQARQLSLDRLVAIKLLPLEISTDRDFADRFRREALAMAKLNHPNIISVFDFGETAEGHLFFVMEYVDGTTLHEAIHLGSPLLPADALAYVQQVCDALAYAHSKGIVHRDVKPLNVMLDREGRVKVADFGLARLLDHEPGEWGTTMTGVVMGTPDYMAPEQRRGSHVDHRADIYALGVVLYESLCRELPQGAFMLPSKRCGLDKRLDGIITRALASRPDERFQTTVELRKALETVHPAIAKAQARGQFSGPHSVLNGSGLFTADRGRKKIALIAGGAVAVIAAAIFVPKPSSWRREVVTSAATPTPAPTPEVLPAVGESNEHNAPHSPAFNNATKEQPYVNSLGMQFVPVPITGGPSKGERVLFSIWETRIRDYEDFARETGQKWQQEAFQTDNREPAGNVSWDDAQAFCAWLTKREDQAHKISKQEAYRLPTEYEWSCAIGLAPLENPDSSPEENQAAAREFVPWASGWRPPVGAGNIADQSTIDKQVRLDGKFLENYDDGHAWTAPVGSYAANGLGLYDLYGNVYEWCQDLFSREGPPLRIIRGSSYITVPTPNFPAIGLDSKPPDFRAPHVGFRVVLAPSNGRPPRAGKGERPAPDHLEKGARRRPEPGSPPPPRRNEANGNPPPPPSDGNGPGPRPPRPEEPAGPPQPQPKLGPTNHSN